MWEIIRKTRGSEIVVETNIHGKRAAIAKLRTHQFFSTAGVYQMRKIKRPQPKIIWAY